ncbi:MAG: flagellar biosynthetic protein FliO [Thermoguttaceae bacterium]|jgi:flagellar biogenesis protein FliO
MTKTKSIRSAVRAIALVLLSACPADLPAQVASQADPSESSAKAALPIAEPKSHNPANRSDQGKKPGGLSSAATVFGSLALVLGVFFALVWALRRAAPPGAALLPAEAFEVLGRAPLANRQQAHLLRCGNKLLLISSNAAGAEPLTEITDPAEVDRLTDLCRQARPSIATTALSRILGQKGKSNG